MQNVGPLVLISGKGVEMRCHFNGKKLLGDTIVSSRSVYARMVLDECPKIKSIAIAGLLRNKENSVLAKYLRGQAKALRKKIFKRRIEKEKFCEEFREAA